MAAVALPSGYHSVNPYLVARDTECLIEFLIGVFGGVEQGRTLRPDGRIDHADVRVATHLHDFT
jgi:PhnB protein